MNELIDSVLGREVECAVQLENDPAAAAVGEQVDRLVGLTVSATIARRVTRAPQVERSASVGASWAARIAG